MQFAVKVLAGLAGAGLLALLVRGDSLSPRARVAAAARSQLGKADTTKYWASALPGQNPNTGLSWCGVFALWALHSAGLATNWLWQLGKGFLMTTKTSLPTTTSPQMGDIAYFTANQHQAVVLSVDPMNRTVELANGNGTGGVVTRSVVPFSSVYAFFSIAPLVGEA